jgi:glycosyltransferase involved in cell wall biosynthesis
MASGVPVLAANATSLPEVVGDAGVLFDPLDDAVLAALLHGVLTNTEYRRELSARGVKRAEAFTWRRTAGGYIEAFEFARQRSAQRRGG